MLRIIPVTSLWSRLNLNHCALSSAVEHRIHIARAAGSNPAARTDNLKTPLRVFLSYVILCVCLTKSEPILNGTDPPPLRSGGPLGRGGRRGLGGGIPPHPSGFRKAIAKLR